MSLEFEMDEFEIGEKFEQSLGIITKAFSDSSEGGAFFLKHMLLPDDPESNVAIAFLYSEIREAFAQNQPKLVDSVLESFAYIREEILKNKKAFERTEQHVDSIIKYKAMLDYVKTEKKKV